MTRLCKIKFNNETFAAYAGDRILDAALSSGIDVPHDCRSGKCGSCLVRVLDGHVLGGAGAAPGLVHACQAIVLSDLRIAAETALPVVNIQAVVTDLAVLARDVVEVTVAIDEPFRWRPGQYINAMFSGFPARAFSPTLALDGSDQPGTFRLHVKRLEGGLVSSEIGRRIAVGHPVGLEGPFGSAFLRDASTDRLVLFSSGTGFAPIWAIADAALRENSDRNLVVVAGVGAIQSLYMARALERMSGCPNVVLIPVANQAQNLSPFVRLGQPHHFAQIISRGDVVHAAGAPDMVADIGAASHAVGAEFYADPFVASGPNLKPTQAGATLSVAGAVRRWRTRDDQSTPAWERRAGT